MNNYLVNIRYCDETLNVKFRQFSDNSTTDFLEQIFGEWNHGSGHECPNLIIAEIRSLSVGDYVNLNGDWYRCENIGWKHKTQAEVDAWFETLAQFRANRLKGNNLGDERYLRWMDKRNTEEKLQLFC